MAVTQQETFVLPQAEAFQLSPDTVFCDKGKKLFDIGLTCLMLPVIVPLMLVIAAGVFCDSPGRIFFYQKRLGRGGKSFIICKFRTMYETTCTTLRDTQATATDLRITRIGRWLRRSSLDELPQLWNVLRGEMSLIGPRPHALKHDAYFSQHVPSYWQRYAIKPGISGWAQVNGCRGETPKIEDIQARVDRDLEYIGLRTLVMDIKILVKTLVVVLKPPETLH